MKKITAILLALLLISGVFCSCTNVSESGKTEPRTDETQSETVTEKATDISEANTDSTGEDAPLQFKLSALPDIGKYSEKKEKFERWYEGYTKKLIARDDYGELVPFIGKYYSYISKYEGIDGEGDEIKSPLYGLATTDGKIVVDPVFKYVDLLELSGGKRVLALVNDTAEVDYSENNATILAASDGSWVIDPVLACRVYADGDVICLENEEYDDVTSCTTDNIYFYSSEGKLISNFSTDNYVENFSEGYAVYYGTSDGGGHSSACYIDTEGKERSEYYYSAESFCNGYAVVDVDGENKGIIDRNMNWFFEPKYKHAKNINGKYFAVSEDGVTFSIYDGEKKLVTDKIVIYNSGPQFFVSGDKVGWEYYDRDEYYIVRDGYAESVVNEDNGIAASDGLYCSGLKNENVGRYLLFSGYDGKNTYYFDADGKTVVKTDTNFKDDYDEIINERYMSVCAQKPSGFSSDIYDMKSGKKVMSFDDENGKYSDIWENPIGGSECLVSVLKYWNSENYNIEQNISDLSTGKVLIDGVEEFNFFELGRRAYLSVVTGKYMSLYEVADDKLNELLSLKRNETD